MGAKGRVTYKGTNDTAKVEDCPEPGDKVAFGLLWRVGEHDSTLRTPQNTGATSQQRSSEDVEARVLGVTVAEERCDVNDVAKTAEGESHFDADSVDDGTREET